MDPMDRYSAEEALAHPYVAKFSDPSDEVCYSFLVDAVLIWILYCIAHQ